MKLFFSSLLLVVLMHSCVIEERFHVNEDMSGTYNLDFNFGGFAEMDSTGEFSTNVSHSMDSIADLLKKMDGVTKVKNKTDKEKSSVSFNWKDLETINKVERMDEEQSYDHDVFTKKKKTLTFRPYIDDINKAMNSDEEEEADTEEEEEEADVDPDAMNQMMGSMIEYKVIITFDDNVKMKSAEHFEEKGKGYFEFSSKTSGFDVEPSLEVDIK